MTAAGAELIEPLGPNRFSGTQPLLLSTQRMVPLASR